MLLKQTRNLPNGYLCLNVKNHHGENWQKDNICHQSYNLHFRDKKAYLLRKLNLKLHQAVHLPIPANGLNNFLQPLLFEEDSDSQAQNQS